MARSLAAVVRDLVPNVFTNRSTSVVRVETTRPVFLLFGADWTRPACVARVGKREDLEALHDTLTTLHRHVPDLVPASLACVPWEGDLYLHVQKGLPGVPWFTLSETLRSEAQWTSIEVRARDGLARLHAAIAEQPEWRCRVRPGDQLRHQTEVLISQDPSVPSTVATALGEAARTLDTLGEVDWFWQHGDFCLNNLMVTPTSIGIIDWDEFGATSVPLQDEIGLGWSVNQLSATQENLATAAQHISACVQPTAERHPELLPFVTELFMHYVVWRMNRAFGLKQRQPARAKLMTLLRTAAESPVFFLRSST